MSGLPPSTAHGMAHSAGPLPAATAAVPHATPLRVRNTLASFLGSGQAHRLADHPLPITIDAASASCHTPESEERRFLATVQKCGEFIRELGVSSAPDETRKLLLAMWQSVLIDKTGFIDVVTRRIAQGELCDTALQEYFDGQIRRLSNAVAVKRFATDLGDLRDLLKHIVTHGTAPRTVDIPPGSVVVADQLSVPEILQLRLESCAGIVLGTGSTNSHQAIIARKRDIPMVVVNPEHLHAIRTGDTLIVNGPARRLVINPNPHQLAQAKRLLLDSVIAGRDPLQTCPSVTRDGTHVQLLGNVSSLDDIQVIREAGITEGVGIVRTEMILIAARRRLDEDEQAREFQPIVRGNKRAQTTFRIFDVAQDKPLPWQRATDISAGLQGVRFALAFEDEFRIHVRAILRAGAEGPIRIMFPFITDERDMRQCRDIVREEQARLAERGVPHARDVPIGAMIETGGAVNMVGAIARYADFLSLGTGDLVRSVLMIGREEDLPNRLPAAYHPAVLQAIIGTVRRVEKARAKLGKPLPLSVCGDAASDPTLTPMLLGAGIRSFSVDASQAARVNHQIRRFSREQCEALVAAMSDLGDDTQANLILRVFHKSPQHWERGLRWIEERRARLSK